MAEPDQRPYSPNGEKDISRVSQDPTPKQICNEQLRNREDLQTYQEEADTIIVMQANVLIKEGYSSLHVLCDDTDVFIFCFIFTINFQSKQAYT